MGQPADRERRHHLRHHDLLLVGAPRPLVGERIVVRLDGDEAPVLVHALAGTGEVLGVVQAIGEEESDVLVLLLLDVAGGLRQRDVDAEHRALVPAVGDEDVGLAVAGRHRGVMVTAQRPEQRAGRRHGGGRVVDRVRGVLRFGDDHVVAVGRHVGGAGADRRDDAAAVDRVGRLVPDVQGAAVVHQEVAAGPIDVIARAAGFAQRGRKGLHHGVGAGDDRVPPQVGAADVVVHARIDRVEIDEAQTAAGHPAADDGAGGGVDDDPAAGAAVIEPRAVGVPPAVRRIDVAEALPR